MAVSRPMRLLNLYRTVAAGVLFLVVIGGEPTRVLASTSRELFLWTAGLYLTFAVVSSFTIRLSRPSPTIQMYTQLAVDIVAITILAYASGGMRSGLGGLLFVPVATGSQLAPRRFAVLSAALATLAMLGAELYAQLNGVILDGGYTQAGILGMILFITAFVGSILADRARESEALAAQRGIDLANLAQLNQYVIRHLQTGVIAVDEHLRVRMINTSAAKLLGIDESVRGESLERHAPGLARCLRDWRARPWDELPTLAGADSGVALVPHLTPLGMGASAGTLVFIEDSRVVAERMQAMKLAALGRLTASIAHEIRNPLGAVSHAGQLLGESDRIGDEERRLTEIIKSHTDRVNTIVENVLQLSRRQNTRPESLELGPWLHDFAREFAETNGLGGGAVRVAEGPVSVTVRVDPSHLHQVLWNLCDNALRHARDGSDPTIELALGAGGGGPPGLAVLDRGPGIEPSIVQHIFEPFYGASAKGTGLGLFIARELCECNRARLSYTPRPGGGSEFRISFADPSRWVV